MTPPPRPCYHTPEKGETRRPHYHKENTALRERAVVVGAGGISGAWFPPLISEKVDIAAVVDLDAARANARLAQYNLDVPVFTNLKAALKKTQPDFVVDLTVPEAHGAVTCAALRAGCHVIGEKPMASSMAEARRMVKTAEETGQLYMVSQSRRWDARHDRMRRAVNSKQLGVLTTMNCDFYIGAHFGGFRDEMPSPLILDMSIHHFDLARYLTGVDPVAVYAKEFNPHGSWYRGDVAASCIFEMSDGVIFTYRGSWCAEGCHTSWNGDWRIIGHQGTMLMTAEDQPRGQQVTNDEGFYRQLADIDVPESPLEFGGHARRAARDARLPAHRREAADRVPRQHQVAGHGFRRHRKLAERQTGQHHLVTRSLGLFLWFGVAMPLAARLRAIHEAGFQTVSLWWDVRRGMGRDRLHALPALVRAAGLQVENAHWPFARCNELWSDDPVIREAAVARHLGWLDECAGCGVPLAVMHLTSGDDPPPPITTGLEAVRRIIEAAEARGITIAVENTRKPAYLDLVLAEIVSPRLGFCYDSSHERLWGSGDLLRRHGHRLVAVHLSDNDGRADRHWLPGDGVIEWPAVLRDFPRETYHGPVTLEVVTQDEQEAPCLFLDRAGQRVRWLAGLLENPTH